MRIEKEIIKEGSFWLQGDESNAIQGILSIKENEVMRLEVNGSFNSNKTIFENPNIGRVLGKIDNYGEVTLDGCFYVHQEFKFDGYSKSIVHVNHAYLGLFLKDNDDAIFDSVLFNCDFLEDWVGITGISYNHTTENETYNITYKKPEDIKININENLDLTICFGCNLPKQNPIKEAGFKQQTYLKITAINRENYNTFDKIAHKIVGFLSIAVGQQLVISSMTGFVKNRRDGVKIHYQSARYVDYKKLDNKEMLFNYNLVKNDFEIMLKSWMSLYQKASPAISLYFSSVSKQHSLAEGRFIALVQGLETYHRNISNEKRMTNEEFEIVVKEVLSSCPDKHKKWLETRINSGNEISLTQRVKRIIEPFKSYTGGNSSPGKLSYKIATTRNYLTHYNPSYENTSAKGVDLYKLIILIESLFLLHFLKAIGFDDEKISLIMRKPFNPLRKSIDYAISK